MAKGKNIENAPSDLNSALEKDFNNFIRGVLFDLSERKIQ